MKSFDLFFIFRGCNVEEHVEKESQWEKQLTAVRRENGRSNAMYKLEYMVS